MDTIITNPDTLMSTESARLSDAIRALDTAEAAYAANVTNHPWVRSGDNAEAIRAELDARHRPILERARNDVLKVAETVRANARAVVNQTQTAELTLSDAEMQIANTRRAFVREDCETRPLSELANAVRHALSTNDRPTLYLYARYVPLRLKTGDRQSSGEWGDSTDRRSRDRLQQMIGTASDMLRDRSLVPLHNRAMDLSMRAGDLQRRIERPRMQQRQYAFQSTHEVSW